MKGLAMKLRIHADFNSRGDGDGAWCWCLRYNDGLLDEAAQELQVSEGQAVTLYYEDPAEEFEYDAVLSLRNGQWMALPNESSFQRLRG
jgi:hypothetical protein